MAANKSLFQWFAMRRHYDGDNWTELCVGVNHGKNFKFPSCSLQDMDLARGLERLMKLAVSWAKFFSYLLGCVFLCSITYRAGIFVVANPCKKNFSLMSTSLLSIWKQSGVGVNKEGQANKGNFSPPTPSSTTKLHLI